MSNKRTKLNAQSSASIRKIVSENFCFKTQYNGIKSTHDSYEYYRNHLAELKDILTSGVYLAFDTNLLLDLYKMSNVERNEFLRFVDRNASRIIIPAQVQAEYMRHRVEHIVSFRKQVTDLRDLAKSHSTNIKKAFATTASQFKQLAQNSLVKNDMPDVLPHIQAIKDYIEANDSSQDFKNEIDRLSAPLNEALAANIDKLLANSITEFEDPVLTSISKTIILEPLSEQEYDFIKEKYKTLLAEFNFHKSEGEPGKYPYCFPGCGDRKKLKKGFDPTGDFIIYHEILSFMSHIGKDVFFLTRDVTKSDWIMEDGKPFNHYIVDTYRNTGKMLFIFNAEKFIPLTFKPIIEEEDGEDDDSDSVGKDGDAIISSTILSNLELDNLTIESVEDVEHDEAENEGTQEPRLSYLRDITEERFMEELANMEAWARDNAENFVTVYRFIYQRLRYKHFDFNTSKAVMRKLYSEGKVDLYKVAENKNLCIRTKSK